MIFLPLLANTDLGRTVYCGMANMDRVTEALSEIELERLAFKDKIAHLATLRRNLAERNMAASASRATFLEEPVSESEIDDAIIKAARYVMLVESGLTSARKTPVGEGYMIDDRYCVSNGQIMEVVGKCEGNIAPEPGHESLAIRAPLVMLGGGVTILLFTRLIMYIVSHHITLAWSVAFILTTAVGFACLFTTTIDTPRPMANWLQRKFGRAAYKISMATWNRKRRPMLVAVACRGQMVEALVGLDRAMAVAEQEFETINMQVDRATAKVLEESGGIERATDMAPDIGNDKSLDTWLGLDGLLGGLLEKYERNSKNMRERQS